MGHKTNMSIIVTFLYTNNEQSEIEMKTIAPKNTVKWSKHFALNVSKDIKNLYTETYQALLKEIKQDTINRKASHVHGLELNSDNILI